MDTGSFFLILSVLLITTAVIMKPFFDQNAHRVTEEEQVVSSLMAERDRILDAVQELDFDFKLGKIMQADYERQRTRLLETGVGVLKQIDDKVAALPVTAHSPDVEAAIEARRITTQNGKPLATITEDDDIETLLAARRRDKENSSAGFCPQCGHAVQKTDKFCSKCGGTL
jgi:NADH pyrophosphatase NudC (nudix superfamily)